MTAGEKATMDQPYEEEEENFQTMKLATECTIKVIFSDKLIATKPLVKGSKSRNEIAKGRKFCMDGI